MELMSPAVKSWKLWPEINQIGVHLDLLHQNLDLMLNFQRWQDIVWKGNLFSLFVWFCCLEVKTFPQFGKRKYSYHSHPGRGPQVNISWSFHKGELWTYIRFSVKRIPTFFFKQIHSCLDCFVHLVETTILPLFLWSSFRSWSTESIPGKGLKINGISLVGHTDNPYFISVHEKAICILYSVLASRGQTLSVKGSSITPNHYLIKYKTKRNIIYVLKRRDRSNVERSP